MNAQLGLSNVWLASGNLRKARLEADRFLESALSTAEPNLQALAWEVGARVAMAEKDWKGAEEKIEKGLAVLQKYRDSHDGVARSCHPVRSVPTGEE